MERSLDISEVPPVCPSCTADHGDAYSISADRGKILIAYRCPSCQHVWSIAREDVYRWRELAYQPDLSR